MDIKIVDLHLREYLKTKAKPHDIAKALSLTSASVEKIEKLHNDIVYHTEITTNRVDMAGVIGIAREAAASLPQFGFDAEFLGLQTIKPSIHKDADIEIINNDQLVKRICAVVIEITLGTSPEYIKSRLEAAGIRSLNNVIDITNYVMLEVGHPTHAFDYDRLTTKKLIIRESKKGEKITTLDEKDHTLFGGDIVADNGHNEIIDLLGVMGTKNSVVTNQTKRILFFINNNDSTRIRKTSMSLGIRTEAATINEKDVDPELAMTALLRGIQLYHQVAHGKVISEIIDIYKNPSKEKMITVSSEKIDSVIGVHISLDQAISMLSRLGFHTMKDQENLCVTIPSWRMSDIDIPEDIIEEIARMYGYHNLPSKLPYSETIEPFHIDNPFYFERRIKEALKYWGFSETYTYSMVSETLLEGPTNQAVKLKNPLDEEHLYMRRSLTPSLLDIVQENKKQENMALFEIANVYEKQLHGLPKETRMLAFIMKGKSVDFYHAKGLIEQLGKDIGVIQIEFTDAAQGGLGADIYIEKNLLGSIEVLDHNLIDCEINFDLLLRYATLKKIYTPFNKYPPVIEDISVIADQSIKTGDIIEKIMKQNPLITNVSLLDQYANKRTFHIVYQDREKNLTSEEVSSIRKTIISLLEKQFHARLA